MGGTVPTTNPSQGTPTTTEPQAPAQGNGQGQQSTADGFWGMFPDIPEEHRSLLEPSLKGVQGHVTKLEQQIAGFKPLMDAGYTPDQVKGLASFSAAFDQDPLGTWVAMAQKMQADGLIHEDLDIDELVNVASGKALENGGFDEEPVDQGTPQEPDRIAELEAQIAQMREQQAQQSQMTQAQVEDRLLQTQISKIRTTLTEAGIPEELITDQQIVANLIAHKGVPSEATKSLLSFRDGLLKGFTDKKTESTGELNMPKGSPPAPPKGRTPRDGFEKARGGAEQFLKQNMAAAAQE